MLESMSAAIGSIKCLVLTDTQNVFYILLWTNFTVDEGKTSHSKDEAELWQKLDLILAQLKSFQASSAPPVNQQDRIRLVPPTKQKELNCVRILPTGTLLFITKLISTEMFIDHTLHNLRRRR